MQLREVPGQQGAWPGVAIAVAAAVVKAVLLAKVLLMLLLLIERRVCLEGLLLPARRRRRRLRQLLRWPAGTAGAAACHDGARPGPGWGRLATPHA
jgi:hypothetical protein